MTTLAASRSPASILLGVLILTSALAAVGCDEGGSGPGGVLGVVYGQDNRQDYFSHPDTSLRALTQASIVALIPPHALEMSDPQRVNIIASSLGDAYGLCQGERFADQPTAASCSGTLIDDDLVLTAGHCMVDGCESFRYVFNYYYESTAKLASITSEDVFSCKKIAAMRYNDGGDWAIVQLNRAATPRHAPASMAAPRAVTAGESMTIIGSGSGLPFKIDNGGQVVKPNATTQDVFTATTDAFGGNSGSGVFTTGREVIGILVAGATDYVYTGSCYSVAEEPSDGASTGGEIITYAHNAINGLCAQGWPSARLCGSDVAATCGDGVCSAGEDCDADCASTSGGLPTGWTCPANYYGAGDDCDCNCGVYDPDCDDASLRVYGCEEGERCGGDAVCRPPASLPEGWTCSERQYDAADGCHCDCGAPDPDCAVEDAEVMGCLPNQTCNAQGACEGDPRGDDGDIFGDGGGDLSECSVTPLSSRPSPLLLIALVLGFGWLRRTLRRDVLARRAG